MASIRLCGRVFELPHAAAKALQQGRRSCPPGASLLHEGEAFGCVVIGLDGWLSSTKSFENGDTQLIDFVLPGDLLDPALADGVTAGVSLTALTEARFAVLSTPIWHHCLHENGALRDAVDHILAAQRARFSERILRLGKGDAKTRIAYVLLEFCVRLDVLESGAGQSFHIPLTQGHLGEFTGLSTVHVCRILRHFVQAGVIETSDHMDIRIVDLDALSRIAGIRAAQLAFEIRPFPG